MQNKQRLYGKTGSITVKQTPSELVLLNISIQNDVISLSNVIIVHI